MYACMSLFIKKKDKKQKQSKEAVFKLFELSNELEGLSKNPLQKKND